MLKVGIFKRFFVVLLVYYTQSGIEIGEDEEVVDMCKAIEDMKKMAEERGEDRGKLMILSELVDDNTLSLNDAASKAGMKTDEFSVAIAGLH